MNTNLVRLMERARDMTPGERKDLAAWRAGRRPVDSATWSQFQMAVSSTQQRAKEAGRLSEVLKAMDDAFRAVAASAGHGGPISYFAPEREPADWEPAARTAAEVAAAFAAADLIPDEMYRLIAQYWLKTFIDPSLK